jgi:hypothetical protein
MKKVFNSNAQLCHAWANNTQQYGKASNLFFNNGTIYSYGYHYELAQQITATTGEKIIFVNENNYSNSTAKHKNHVIRSIPSNIRCYIVPFTNNRFSVDMLQDSINAMAKNVEDLINKQLNAKTVPYYFSEAEKISQNITEICELFNLSKPNTPDNWEKARTKSIDILNAQQAIQEKKKERAAERDKELLNKWLNNEYNGQLYNIPVHLRLSKDRNMIETTKGASVKLSSGIYLFNKSKEANIKGEKLEGFTVLNNFSESITIGCHVIEWEKINNFFENII